MKGHDVLPHEIAIKNGFCYWWIAGVSEKCTGNMLEPSYTLLGDIKERFRSTLEEVSKRSDK